MFPERPPFAVAGARGSGIKKKETPNQVVIQGQLSPKKDVKNSYARLKSIHGGNIVGTSSVYKHVETHLAQLQSSSLRLGKFMKQIRNDDKMIRGTQFEFNYF